jgi:hypothetical protein
MDLSTIGYCGFYTSSHLIPRKVLHRSREYIGWVRNLTAVKLICCTLYDQQMSEKDNDPFLLSPSSVIFIPMACFTYLNVPEEKRYSDYLLVTDYTITE